MSVAHSRELADTLQEVRIRHGKKRCRYCGAETRSSIGVCLAHSDLLAIDPNYDRARWLDLGWDERRRAQRR